MTCRVDTILGSWFYKLGLAVGRTPGYFIIVPILLTLLCITGYQRVHYEMDPEYLFSPQNGEGKYERAVVESFFKMNYSARFNPTRITRPGQYRQLCVTFMCYWHSIYPTTPQSWHMEGTCMPLSVDLSIFIRPQSHNTTCSPRVYGRIFRPEVQPINVL